MTQLIERRPQLLKLYTSLTNSQAVSINITQVAYVQPLEISLQLTTIVMHFLSSHVA